ncbi:MAG: hypothetical protein JNL32_00085 [Candidatus Kapabacteria bacterium]|nr:hypothetical protein [Candidatus Kapabacteria bacterium]
MKQFDDTINDINENGFTWNERLYTRSGMNAELLRVTYTDRSHHPLFVVEISNEDKSVTKLIYCNKYGHFLCYANDTYRQWGIKEWGYIRSTTAYIQSRGGHDLDIVNHRTIVVPIRTWFSLLWQKIQKFGSRNVKESTGRGSL